MSSEYRVGYVSKLSFGPLCHCWSNVGAIVAALLFPFIAQIYWCQLFVQALSLLPFLI